MRPVSKLKVGEQIEIDGTMTKIKDTYKRYQDAKPSLTKNIGEYCSYCERPVSDEAIAIEHIQAKRTKDDKGQYKYKHLEYKWSNFLLTCMRCNGKDNKSNKDVIYDNIYLPHLHNTMVGIHYGQGGIVMINSNLNTNSSEYKRTKALIDLVGLDKRPGHPDYKKENTDNRWRRRDEVWQMAEKYKRKFDYDETDIESIIDIAKSLGFFSVWFAVFQDYSMIRLALIKGFKGTATECFDSITGELIQNFDRK